MEVQSTLAIVKPDAYPHADDIATIIANHGFSIASKQTLTLTKDRASEFYAEHKTRFFFDDLIEFMTSGPVVVLAIRKNGAINAWRELIGPTNVEKAREEAPSSIRARYGSDKTRNAVHGSDAVESSKREIFFFFPDYEPPTQFEGNDAKNYLARSVSPTLTKALTDMCTLNPPNPFEWIGYRLLRTANADVEYFPRSTTAKPDVVATQKPEEGRRIYFVLGGPGSGKGTQCSKLVENFGFDHFSAGELLRAEVKSGSEQGQMIDEIIKEGKIVPGDITISLLKKAIKDSKAPGVLIDGFPRQLEQAGAFEKDVSDFEFVLFFDCPEEEMEQRLLERGKTSGRSDDNIESIRKRFKTFIDTSMPVISYYEAKGKVHRIDATKSIEEVTADVVKLFWVVYYKKLDVFANFELILMAYYRTCVRSFDPAFLCSEIVCVLV